MTTAYGTQGQTLAVDTESTLGTAAGSAVDIRFDELTFPTATEQSVENRPRGRENWADNQDKPINFEGVQEDAISVTTKCRVSTTNTDPMTFFATMGGMGTDDFADTTCTITSGTIDTVGNIARPGRAMLCELDDGRYFPVLGAETESAGAVDITMNPPDDSAALSNCYEMTTIYPKQVELSTYGNFLWNTRGIHTTAPDLAYQAAGCALSSIGTISLEPNMPLSYQFGFHAGDVDQKSDTMDNESLAFGENVPIINDDFQFGFASAPSDDNWSLSNSCANLIKADIDLNHGAIVVPATGCTSTLNGIQGYYAQPGVPRITIEMLMDKARWDDWEGTNADKYIHFVQPTSTVGTSPVPAFGFWFPRCYLVENPVMISDGDFYRMTLVYEAYSAGFESTTTNNSQGMAPWYYAVGGYKSA